MMSVNTNSDAMTIGALDWLSASGGAGIRSRTGAFIMPGYGDSAGLYQRQYFAV